MSDSRKVELELMTSNEKYTECLKNINDRLKALKTQKFNVTKGYCFTTSKLNMVTLKKKIEKILNTIKEKTKEVENSVSVTTKFKEKKDRFNNDIKRKVSVTKSFVITISSKTVIKLKESIEALKQPTELNNNRIKHLDSSSRLIGNAMSKVSVTKSYITSSSKELINKIRQSLASSNMNLMTKNTSNLDTSSRMSNSIKSRINVNKSYVTSSSKQILSRIKNSANEVKDTISKIEQNKKEMSRKGYNFNKMKSYVTSTTKKKLAKIQELGSKINPISNDELITFTNRNINFKEGICQKINEEKSEIITVNELEKEKIKASIVEVNNNLKSNPEKKEEIIRQISKNQEEIKKQESIAKMRKKIANTGGYIANRTLIIIVSFIIIVISFIVGIKLIK